MIGLVNAWLGAKLSIRYRNKRMVFFILSTHAVSEWIIKNFSKKIEKVLNNELGLKNHEFI